MLNSSHCSQMCLIEPAGATACTPARRLKRLPGQLSLYTLTSYVLRSIQREWICFRNHCGAEPPRDIEPAGLVPTVGWERSSVSFVAQPTVSKHLRVLREAGFVEST